MHLVNRDVLRPTWQAGKVREPRDSLAVYTGLRAVASLRASPVGHRNKNSQQ